MINRIKVSIWDREFDLEYDLQNFPGEMVTDNQKKAVEFISKTDFAESKVLVEQYIYKNNQADIKDGVIGNIFRYVMPKNIVIPREDDKVVFAILCDYKFDMEHGLAIVYEGTECKEIGTEDIIL